MAAMMLGMEFNIEADRAGARLRDEPVQPHDYEPGDTTHPMSTDPDCRVCGQPRRACERNAR